jgi:hypothetical protein
MLASHAPLVRNSVSLDAPKHRALPYAGQPCTLGAKIKTHVSACSVTYITAPTSAFAVQKSGSDFEANTLAD